MPISEIVQQFFLYIHTDKVEIDTPKIITETAMKTKEIDFIIVMHPKDADGMAKK